MRAPIAQTTATQIQTTTRPRRTHAGDDRDRPRTVSRSRHDWNAIGRLFGRGRTVVATVPLLARRGRRRPRRALAGRRRAGDRWVLCLARGGNRGRRCGRRGRRNRHGPRNRRGRGSRRNRRRWRHRCGHRRRITAARPPQDQPGGGRHQYQRPGRDERRHARSPCLRAARSSLGDGRFRRVGRLRFLRDRRARHHGGRRLRRGERQRIPRAASAPRCRAPSLRSAASRASTPSRGPQRVIEVIRPPLFARFGARELPQLPSQRMDRLEPLFRHRPHRAKDDSLELLRQLGAQRATAA